MLPSFIHDTQFQIVTGTIKEGFKRKSDEGESLTLFELIRGRVVADVIRPFRHAAHVGSITKATLNDLAIHIVQLVVRIRGEYH